MKDRDPNRQTGAEGRGQGTGGRRISVKLGKNLYWRGCCVPLPNAFDEWEYGAGGREFSVKDNSSPAQPTRNPYVGGRGAHTETYLRIPSITVLKKTT